jgi:eukaryotic-like serine/threonine-protein kinase
MRLMVIDDDQEFRARVRMLLAARWPHAAYVDYDPVQRGPLAPELLGQGLDAVLLDHHWAHGSGLAWLAELTRRPGFAPIIFLAGEDGQQERARRLGACVALSKEDLEDGRLVAAVAAAAERQAGARTARFETGADGESRVFGGVRLRAHRRVRHIATGNFAELFLAESDRLSELVAIKVARDRVQEGELDHAFRRLLQEHEIARRVGSECAVLVHDLGISDEHAYMVMEYFDQGDLRARMQRPVSAAEALGYAAQIAHALAAVHGAGILHRDLKPGNIMLRRGGGVALIDFGLAKDEQLAEDITEAGQIIGTPHYMSPEQGHGEPIDARSDLYSLGVILFEMLTGAKPYSAENPMAIIYLHRKAPVPQLPAGLESLQELLGRLLGKQPADRFESAGMAAAALARACSSAQRTAAGRA